MKKLLPLLLILVAAVAFADFPGPISGPSFVHGTLTDGKWCTYSSASGIVCNSNEPAGTGTIAGPATATQDNVTCWGADNVTIKDCGVALSALATLAGPTFTGVPAAPTAAADTNTTQIATTAFVVGQGYAKLVSPSFTTPTLGVASATTLNTGQGAYELYAMDQNVQTTDNVTFGVVTATEFVSSAADNTRGVTVPNTADPTTTNLAAGKCWYNITGNTWSCSNGDNTLVTVIGAQVKTFSFGIDNVSTQDNVFLWKVPRAITITQIDCFASVDNVVGSLTECTAADMTSCTAVDDTNFTVGGATLQSAATSFNSGFENAGIAAGAWLKWLTVSAPATSNKLSCTIQYRE